MSDEPKSPTDELRKPLVDMIAVSAMPYLIVRMDWLQATNRWLQWAHTTVATTLAQTETDDTDAKVVLEHMVAELAELNRLAARELECSPLLFMRRRPDDHAPPTPDIPLPPTRDPSEKGC